MHSWKYKLLDFHSKVIEAKVSCRFTEWTYKYTEDLSILFLIYEIEIGTKLDLEKVDDLSESNWLKMYF